MSQSNKQMVKEMFDDMYKVEPTFIKSSGQLHDEAYSKVIDSVLGSQSDNNGIDKPKHYDIGIDTFTRMRANATFEEAMGFIRWNIDKYNTRAKGQDEEDYKKIEAYCKEAMWWFVNRRAKE